MHFGVVLAVAMAVAAWVFLWQSTVGYRIRRRRRPDAARYAGSGCVTR